MRNTLLIVALWLICQPNIAYASHLIGGVLTYQCAERDLIQHKNKYVFTLKLYRDCYSGRANFDDQALLGVYTPNGMGGYNEYQGPGGVISFGSPYSTALGPIRSIDPPTYPCLTPPDTICVQEAIYEWQIWLPDTNVSYHATYQRCCRNQGITNITVDPQSTGATYTVEITADAQHTGNSSPIFNNFPPTVICVGELLQFDHAATDLEGDQLVYEFCPIYGGGSANGVPTAPPYVPVIFRPPYNYNMPLGANGLRIHPNTGLLSGRPTVINRFVVGICVREYRNGQLLSSIYRDFQFNLVSCRKELEAKIDADSVVNKVYMLNTCFGNPLVINNLSGLRRNVFNHFWKFDLPNGQTLEPTDWSPTINFPDTGVYYGQLRLNPGIPCSDSMRMRIQVGGKLNPDWQAVYDTCSTNPVSFVGQVPNPRFPLKQIIWNYGDGKLDSGRLSIIHQYETSGIKKVVLKVADIIGCIGALEKNLIWQPAPPILIVEPDAFVGCVPAKVRFNNRSTPIDSSYKIIWHFGDGDSLRQRDGEHFYKTAGTYSVKLQITSPIGCYKEQNFDNWIKVRPAPKANFIWTSDQIISNFNPTVQFTDKSSADVTQWRWFFNRQNYDFVKNPIYSFRDTGFRSVQLIVLNPYGCKDSITKTVYIEPLVTFFMPNAFTPNYDNRNDLFRGTGFWYGLKGYHLTIWNRWGEQVFESSDPEEGWNGLKNNAGEPAPEGRYLFDLQYITPKGERVTQQNFLTLYR
jgi:gliding motility-associated-like protein